MRAKGPREDPIEFFSLSENLLPRHPPLGPAAAGLKGRTMPAHVCVHECLWTLALIVHEALALYSPFPSPHCLGKKGAAAAIIKVVSRKRERDDSNCIGKRKRGRKIVNLEGKRDLSSGSERRRFALLSYSMFISDRRQGLESQRLTAPLVSRAVGGSLPPATRSHALMLA